MEKKPVSHLLVGLIIGFILIILFLVFYFTGNGFERTALSWLPSLFFVGSIIFAITKYAKAMNHNVTFGSCFAYGFKATAIVAILMGAFLLIFMTTNPQYKTEFLAFMKSEGEKRYGPASDAQAKETMEMMNKRFLLSTVGGGIFLHLITGAIGSVIGAFIAKKNPRTPFQNG